MSDTPGGTGADAMLVSAKLQDAERKEMEKKNLETLKMLERVADEIHDILIREDLTFRQWEIISGAISKDISQIAAQAKIKNLYDAGTNGAKANGSGASTAEGRELEGNSGGEAPSGGSSVEGQEGGSKKPRRQGGKGGSAEPRGAA